MNIEDYGLDISLIPAGAAGIPARITASHRDRYEFVSSYGGGTAVLRGGYYNDPEAVFPTTGDFVMIEYSASGDSRILSTLTRKTCFTRLDPSSAGNGAQVVAADFDFVFILQSLNHDFNLHRLERYLTLSWQSGAAPVVVLTKTDLAPNYQSQLTEAMITAAGAEVYAVSAKTGEGLDALKKYILPKKTLVFLGSSGVGKSSLVNALADEEVMSTGEIREDDSKGRHTTTYRQLIMLKSGAMIIDTPGMRELGMWDVSEGLDRSFADVEKYTGRCKFSDCTHTNEPGCAIRAAIESGELDEARWQSYTRLKNEAVFADDKESYLAAKKDKFKAIAKYNKNNKK